MSALRQITLGALLSETAKRFPKRPAMEYDGQTTAFLELDMVSDSIAKGLLALGMQKGSHIAIWSTDRPNTLTAFFAAVKIGAVAVLPNTSLKFSEFSALLENTYVDLLLYGEGYKDVSFPETCAALPPLPRLKDKLYIGESPAPGADGMERLIALGRSIPGRALAKAKEAVRPEDTAVILYTSGTAGASRGVMTSHFSRVNSAILQAKDLRATEEDKFLVAIPMFHCFSLSANILAAVACGGCLYFPENRRTHSILSGVAAGRCTVFHAVPTLFHALLARPDFGSYDLSSLRIGLIGGSKHLPEQMLQFRERMGYELLPSLGLTEATAGITVASPEDPLPVKLETVGHFMDHTEGRIADPYTGAPLPVGETGEICVRGYCVMQGYYGLPEQTAKAIDSEGFLHTGDLGRLDADGNLHFEGRIKEVIIRGGENIFPSEIEECIRKDARIAAVKVIGVPDDHYGEAVCACVAPVAGAAVTADEVRAMVSGRLAYYKTPRHVLFFDALPTGPSGKVLLKALSEAAKTKIEEGF